MSPVSSQPSAVVTRAGRRPVAEVAAHQARTLQADPTDRAFREGVAVRRRGSRPRSPAWAGRRATNGRVRAARPIAMSAPRRAPGDRARTPSPQSTQSTGTPRPSSRERHRQRRLGQTIARQERRGVETRRARSARRTARARGPDHLAADAGDPPRSTDRSSAMRLVGRAAHAELIAERRAERDRPAVLGHNLEPGQRPPREARGRDVIDRGLGHHRRQAAADQAHVVVERQPGDAAVAGRQPRP